MIEHRRVTVVAPRRIIVGARRVDLGVEHAEGPGPAAHENGRGELVVMGTMGHMAVEGVKGSWWACRGGGGGGRAWVVVVSVHG